MKTMKTTKTTITILLAAFMSIAAVKAQSIQEGLNHLYADRDKSAKETFEKLVATNPNNLDAVYWLGQSHITLQDVAAAKNLYSKTLQANGNAPLILVGMGHVDLLESKKAEARQRFETAISLSTGKKGPDPIILHAIGRANVDAKEGDVAYAIEKLKLAAEKAPQNGDMFLTLGDAYRKAHEGGQAVVNYDRAIQATPTLARAAYRKGMIYYTQRNWELFEQYLKQSITMDPKFAPAYYDLYYYYLGKLDFATAQDFANKFISNTEQDPQNDYLRLQTMYVQKQYDEAISGAKNLIAAVGAKAKPRVFRLLARAYVEKGDTAAAKQYIDEFFAKAKEEDIIPADYIVKGQIYGALTGDDNVVVESYRIATDMDTVYATRMNTLIDALDAYKKQGKKSLQGGIGLLMYKIKKNPNHADLFQPGLAYYQAGQYQKADSIFNAYSAAYPDSIFGYYWGALANLALDTSYTVEPYVSNMVNGFKRTLDVAATDKEKYKSQAIRASTFLAAIYNNTKKDKDSAIFYIDKGLEFDPSNASLNGLKKQLMQAPKPAKGNTPGSKPANSSKPNAATKKPAATKTKSAAAKKKADATSS